MIVFPAAGKLPVRSLEISRLTFSERAGGRL